MNIALCFSGQVRDFAFTRQSLQKYILSNLSDFNLFAFCHVPAPYQFFSFTELGIPPERTVTVCEDETKVLSLSQHIESAVIDPRPWHEGNSYRRFYLQLRSIYRSMAICADFSKSTGIRFDWVFRLRFDNLYFGESIEDLRYLDSGVIYIPEHDNWQGLNDRFAFGGPASMAAYSERFKLFSVYQTQGYAMHPEEFLAWTLHRAGIPVKRTRITMHLLRYGSLWPATYLPSKGDGPLPARRWWFKLWRRLRRTRFASLSDRGYLAIIRIELFWFQLLHRFPSPQIGIHL